MGRFLAGLFGKQGQPVSQPAASQRVQSSLYGKPIPWLIAGQQRLSSNLIWYGNVYSVDQATAGGQGGKGGYFTQGTPNNSKFYYASIAFCVAEGPIAGVLSIWPHGTPRDINAWSRQFNTAATTVSPTVFLGDHAQLPWGFLQAFKPAQALAYRGLAYIAVTNFPLGTSASLPNINWEVRALNSYGTYAPIASITVHSAAGVVTWTNTPPTLTFSGSWVQFDTIDFSILGVTGTHTAGAAFPTSVGLAGAFSNTTNLAVPNWNSTAANGVVSAPQVTTGSPDGEPSQAMLDFLTDKFRGVGFPAARIDTLAQYRNYCIANGLLVSPALTSAIVASAHLIDQMAATNSNVRWSSGLMTVVPYGDQAVLAGQILQTAEPRTIPATAIGGPGTGKYWITVNQAATFVADIGVTLTLDGSAFTKVSPATAPRRKQYNVQNGVYKFSATDHGLGVTINYTWSATASYQPQTQPIYDLTTDDFLPNQGSLGSMPSTGNTALVISRKPRDKIFTSVRVECLDRGFAYNPQPIEIKDEASILLLGREKPGSVKQLHMICLPSVAQFAATQLMVRECIPRLYQFTISRAFVLLDPLDNVTVSDPMQQVFRQLVKITEITENGDRSLTIDAEEAPGTASAPLYGTEAPQGYIAGNNADPGSVTQAIIFEPTAELLAGGKPAVWAGLDGGPDWGGCFVWVSSDGGQNYVQLPGQLSGPSRIGVTTSVLAPVPVNLVGQTADNISVLGVDISASGGQLMSASAADAAALRTACLVGNEIISYQTAALVSTGMYNLSLLFRGVYGTEDDIATTHGIGTRFLRLDAGVYEFPINAGDVGKQILIKFQSFNLFNEGLQSLADVPPFSYTIIGRAYSSPLPAVANITSVTVDGRLAISWDEIGANDFRGGIFYEIRAGATYDGAMVLALVAHPPFVVPAGTNTYWLVGWCQPLPTVIVRSETPVSIAVSNATVVTNVIATFDEKALGWPGTFANGAGIDTGINAVRTGGSGNILASAIVATILSGSYVGGTGLVTLNLSVAHGLLPGDLALISGATGTGSFASINGVQTAGLGTAGSTLTFTIATGLTMTISGGNYTEGNILEAGGEQPGTYTPGQIIDVGRVDTCAVFAQTTGTGVPVGQDILLINDILALTDVLGASSAAFINVYPEVAFGPTTPPTNWQKFAPGRFTGRYFQMRWQLVTLDPKTIGYLLAASWGVDVPDRVDHPLQNGSLAAGGISITFKPDGSATNAAFNGGPDGTLGSLPTVVLTCTDGSKLAGDIEFVTALTLAGCTVQIKNAGVGVARTGVSIYVYGW